MSYIPTRQAIWLWGVQTFDTGANMHAARDWAKSMCAMMTPEHGSMIRQGGGGGGVWVKASEYVRNKPANPTIENQPNILLVSSKHRKSRKNLARKNVNAHKDGQTPSKVIKQKKTKLNFVNKTS